MHTVVRVCFGAHGGADPVVRSAFGCIYSRMEKRSHKNHFVGGMGGWVAE